MEAVGAMNDDVHLLFLDINMPGITGLELSRLVSGKTRIIFTTAFREYALDSYEVNALDYLLKPINYTAFLKAVTKGKEWFEQQERLSEMSLAQVQDAQRNFIFVKSDYRQVRVNLDDILFISGMKDYVRIHLASGGRPVIALSTMKAIEEKLPQSQFCRVHRSYIVAISQIESIEHNRIKIGDELIPISENYLDDFNSKIE
jgi:DNA-binding LytR/AlgR family response regulator